jgi:hypothetical protein
MTLRPSAPKTIETMSAQRLVGHHDNAPAHRALLVQPLLADKIMSVVPHLLYSHDLDPCDFLFPRMKSQLKKRRIRNFTEMQQQPADRRTCDSKMSVPVVLKAAAEILNPLHKLERAYF